jgi:serine/threonine-protein kinase RsbW
VIEETAKLKLPSRIESIAGAAEAAAQFARLLGFAEDTLFGIDLAVREAVANAVVHGNRQDESKAVEIGFTTSGAGIVVTVCDQCDGFDPAGVADPTAADNLFKTSGRGILLMSALMDEVSWERHPRGGTLVRMTKKK